jgi:hypothetical protein
MPSMMVHKKKLARVEEDSWSGSAPKRTVEKIALIIHVLHVAAARSKGSELKIWIFCASVPLSLNFDVEHGDLSAEKKGSPDYRFLSRQIHS